MRTSPAIWRGRHCGTWAPDRSHDRVGEQPGHQRPALWGCAALRSRGNVRSPSHPNAVPPAPYRQFACSDRPCLTPCTVRRFTSRMSDLFPRKVASCAGAAKHLPHSPSSVWARRPTRPTARNLRRSGWPWGISRRWRLCRPLPIRSSTSARCRPIRSRPSWGICTSRSSPSSSTCCRCISSLPMCGTGSSGRSTPSASSPRSSCCCKSIRSNGRGRVRWDGACAPNGSARCPGNGTSPGTCRRTGCSTSSPSILGRRSCRSIPPISSPGS